MVGWMDGWVEGRKEGRKDEGGTTFHTNTL